MSQNFNKQPEQQHSNVAHLLDQSTTAPPALSPAEIRGLNRKLRVLIRYGGVLKESILHPKNISPSRQFIKLGGYYSDQLKGWLHIDQIHVVEVLEEMPDETQPKECDSF